MSEGYMKICYSDSEYLISRSGLNDANSLNAIKRTHTLVTF